MSSFTEMFTSNEDRAQVLTEVLDMGPAFPGVTLIAYVERATHEVVTVRSLSTPQPCRDARAELVGASHPLSLQLRAFAEDMVPMRSWTGDRWGPMTGELLTVVCRDGDAAISATEEQFFWGWRYSNHHTVAFDGDVYVVTPGGWANLLGNWSGRTPALPSGADAGVLPLLDGGREASVVPAFFDSGERHPDEHGTDEHGHAVLVQEPDVLVTPGPGECLLCYVHRMLQQHGCGNNLRFARHYRDVRAPRATGLERRLGSAGGFCDCEIFLNAYDLRLEFWWRALTHEEDGCTVIDEAERWPDPLPDCLGVRAGSTQPCTLWRRASW